MLCPCNAEDCVAKVVPLAPTRFKIGQVVVTEGTRKDVVSRLIRWATGSWWTHCFVVTGADELTEAWFPRARTFQLSKRVKELKEQGRAYVVLDLPGITARQRCDVARAAHDLVGHYYDLGQALCYGLFRRFVVRDGTGTLLCSRCVTGAFEKVGVRLFDTETVYKNFGPNHPRIENLLEDEVIPSDLLRSKLQVTRWKRSLTIRNWKLG